jgi:hypothetical protein
VCGPFGFLAPFCGQTEAGAFVPHFRPADEANATR